MHFPRFVRELSFSHYGWPARNMFGFFFFSIVLIVRLAHHELWRDEVQAWLITASATSFADLLVIPGEGHPPLWYWVLFPFTKLGSDPNLIKVPLAICSIAALSLLWFRMDLSVLEKVMIAAGYFLSFEYGIIARSYILGMLLLWVFAAFHHNIKEYPFAGALLLGLASLTHVFFAMAATGLAALTIALWMKEGVPSKRLLGFGTIFAALLCFALTTVVLSVPPHGGPTSAAAGAPQSVTTQVLHSIVQLLDSLVKVLERLGRAFAPVFRRPWRYLFEALCLYLLVQAFLPMRLSGLVFFCTAVCISISAELLHLGAGARYSGTIYVLFVAIYLIKSREMSVPHCRALLFSSMLGGLATFLPAPPSSMGQHAAILIARANAQDARWAAYPDFTGTVAFAFLGRSFHSFECDCEATFTKWGGQRLGRRPDRYDLEQRIQHFLGATGSGDAYVLVSQPKLAFFSSALPTNIRLDPIFETEPAGEEGFFAFRFSKVAR